MPESLDLYQLGQQLQRPWIVITDLDGTLLDHHDYSHQAADAMLAELERRSIPVVLNTSKTFAELGPLRAELNNQHPFIVENGSAIYIPEGYFAQPPPASESLPGYRRIVLGRRSEELQSWLQGMRGHAGMHFVGFADMTTAEVAAATGLDENSAARAARREFSEAVRWLGSEAAKEEFCRQAQASGWRTLQGGRFLHLLGQCDKGDASRRLLREYADQGSPQASVIAAGDGGNDVDMLRMADLAIVVRSPVNDFPDVPESVNYIRTRHCGPAGWADTLSQLLGQQPTARRAVRSSNSADFT